MYKGFPNKLCSIATTCFIGKNKILDSKLKPVQYNCVKNKTENAAPKHRPHEWGTTFLKQSVYEM